MGIITSRDTRRISFDNTFALSNSALAIPKSISVEDNSTLTFESNLPCEAADEQLIFIDKNKYYSDVQEEGEIDYWARRIEHLKQEHQTINNIVETEYDKQIENTNKTYEPPIITHEKLYKVKPCFDWRTKVMQCYEDNPHQPLVCSTVVQAFNKCVASCRADE